MKSGAVTRLGGSSPSPSVRVVLFAGADIGSFVPKAILGGMLAYLGVTILPRRWCARRPAARAPTRARRRHHDRHRYFGYLVGVVLGVIGACLMFALSYSRIGVIRRHLTRYDFSSNVERSPEQARLLREEGMRLHVFWLSGFIFFGSSNGLFERIRRVSKSRTTSRWAMSCSISARCRGSTPRPCLSLVKLRNYCEEHDVTLVFSVSTTRCARASRGRAFSAAASRIRSSAPATRRSNGARTCSSCITRWAMPPSTPSRAGYRASLAAQLDLSRIAPYHGARGAERGRSSCSARRAAGFRGVLSLRARRHHHHGRAGAPIRLRRMIGYTVVGEMGFYRRGAAHGERHRRRPDGRLPADGNRFDKMQARGPRRRLGAAQDDHQAALRPARIRQPRDLGASLALAAQQVLRHRRA